MLLIGILPVLINAVASYILAQNALNTTTRETQKIIEADQSTYLLSWANERTQDIGTLAGIARISSMDPVTANEAIKQYFRYWGMYETIFLAGPDGKTIATSDDKPLDVSDRSYFSEALSGSVTLSEPLLSKASGHLVIVFASPVRSKSGEIVGVIGETVPVDTLAQLLDKNRSGLTSESYLVNQQGYFVTAPRFVNEMKAAGLITDRAELKYQLQTTASKELQAGKSGQGIYTNYLGEEVIGQYTWLPDIKLGLISEKQTSEANAATTQLATFSLIMIVVSIVLVSLIAFIFSRGITKPVKLMVDISNHLAMGDIDQKLEYKSQDEFGLLADSIREIVGYQKEMSSAANAISTGILTYDVRPKSDKDELGNAFSKMIAGLRETIGLVAQSASAITSAASQLTTAAEQSGEATSQIATTIQQVALGTAQQTEGVTKTSASVEQMGRAIDGVAKGAQEQAKAISQASQITSRINSAIEQVAANAQAVTRDSAQAATYSRDGAKTVKETINGMEAIRSKVGLSATKVEEMGTRSEEIGAIVETIEDIASQTNLLALNAAIEAARAGASGNNASEKLAQTHLVGIALMLAELLCQDSALSSEGLVKLAERLNVEVLSVTNSDGVVIASSRADSMGFRFPDNGAGQAAAFRPLLSQENGVVMQPITPREDNGILYLFVGVSRRDQPGIIQVGKPAQSLLHLGNISNGFAVVADEVRKLAERSSLATKEIAALIKGIQKTASEAVTAMKASAEEVESGVARANSAGEVLDNILGAAESVYKQAEDAGSAAAKVGAAAAELVGAVDAVSAVIEENKAATSAMASNSLELVNAIENIASVSEENSASVEEVSASTEEVSAQVEQVSASAASMMKLAQDLQKVVAQFKLSS